MKKKKKIPIVTVDHSYCRCFVEISHVGRIKISFDFNELFVMLKECYNFLFDKKKNENLTNQRGCGCFQALYLSMEPR